MKTPEDEAFEDIERRQGGFQAKRQMAAEKQELSDPFEKWWYYEGSAPPQRGEDHEEHAKRMCKIAWSNGAYAAAQPVQPERQPLTFVKLCVNGQAQKTALWNFPEPSKPPTT